MFPTSSTIPDTFEEYVDRFMGGDDPTARQRLLDEHGDDVREMFARERLAQQLHPAPADMPPCPSWCATPAEKHDYESIDDLDAEAGMVTLSRFHVSAEHYEDDRPGYISQEEELRDGRVTLLPPVISLSLSGAMGVEDVSAAEARARASAMLKLADRLDAITASQ